MPWNCFPPPSHKFPEIFQSLTTMTNLNSAPWYFHFLQIFNVQHIQNILLKFSIFDVFVQFFFFSSAFLPSAIPERPFKSQINNNNHMNHYYPYNPITHKNNKSHNGHSTEIPSQQSLKPTLACLVVCCKNTSNRFAMTTTYY